MAKSKRQKIKTEYTVPMLAEKLVEDEAFKSKTGAENAVKAVFGTITELLRNGDKLTIKGFGTFDIVERAAREGRNPHSGEAIHIDAKNAVKFKVSKALLNA